MRRSSNSITSIVGSNIDTVGEFFSRICAVLVSNSGISGRDVNIVLVLAVLLV